MTTYATGLGIWQSRNVSCASWIVVYNGSITKLTGNARYRGCLRINEGQARQSSCDDGRVHFCNGEDVCRVDISVCAKLTK